uniref:Abscisic acid receptor PYL8 isoform X2 n=1 Tax=Elaeis guineensis var. tenera TaxID=51953 RepID=A0A6I9RFL8_ELAGV|nr:abscisic acid receptor PYL8 isoform X2 [Elaeis guineensis]
MVGMNGGARGRTGDRAWRLADEMNSNGCCGVESEYVRRLHRHELRENQCSSTLFKHIKAPVHLVWSLVRRFDQPQKYKPFVSRCVMQGDLGIGSVREVNVKSGLPATTSTERLEFLDDNEHILSIKIVGGDHRLKSNSRCLVHLFMIEVIFNCVINITTHSPTCHLAELLIHRYPSPREHRWEARDTGDRVICGGCARWEHQR